MPTQRGYTNERVVALSCGHEQNHSTAQPGDYLGCLTCAQRRVMRSRITEHTQAPQRLITKVVDIPANRVVYTLG